MKRFRNGPSAIVATWFCLFVGSTPVVVFTFGNFMRPLSAEFGWSRALMSAAFAVGALAAAAMSPIVGRSIDHWGLRAVTLPGLIVAGCIVAAQSLNNGSPALLIFLQASVGALTIVITSLPYSKAISSWYDRRRGLALGISTLGAAAGAALIPQLAQAVIATEGWRSAYRVLGAAVIIIGFCPAALLLYEAPRQATTGTGVLSGRTVREACGDWRLWAICGVFLLGAAGTSGLIGQMVPLLTDRGFSVQLATKVLGVFAASNAVSRLVSGFLIDRFFAPYLAAAAFMLAGLGVLLLIGSESLPFVVGAMALSGLALGFESDLLPFLISRYFGMRAFGELAGYAYLSFTLGTGALGPLLMGNSQTVLGSYSPALFVFAAGLGVSGIVLLWFGPYAFPATPREPRDEPMRAEPTVAIEPTMIQGR
jgi:MFS family permease